MDNNVIALKNLYVALGGDAADVADMSLIADVVNALAEIVMAVPKIEGSDIGTYLYADYNPEVAETPFASWKGIQGLPTVTATDNGKILKVVNGRWAVVEE